MEFLDRILSEANGSGLRSLIRGIGLGIGAAMPIGPVNVQIARRILRFGFLAGVAVGLGAVTVDVVYAILSSFGFMQVSEQTTFLRVLGAAGVMFLASLGGLCLRAAKAAWRHDPLSDGPADLSAAPTVRNGYVTGLLMTLLNPMTLVFWFVAMPSLGTTTAGSSAATAVTSQASATDLPMMSAGVFIGTTAWVVTFGGLLWAAARGAGAREPGRRQKWLAAADLIGGITLLLFAVLAALRLLGSLA